MGKIDDMRRQREQQFAEGEQRQAKAAKARPVDVVVVVPPGRVAPPVSAGDSDTEPLQPSRPTRPARGADAKPSTSSESRQSRAAVDAPGKCPDCGKMKPVSNGLLANHQKGFGKACPGSRKKPV